MSRISFGQFELQAAARLLLADGVPVAIRNRAFDVLRVLVEGRNRLIDKTELIDAAWPGRVVEENNLSVQISELRKILGRDAIRTVAGRGYGLAIPIRVDGIAAVRVPPRAAADPDIVAPSGELDSSWFAGIDEGPGAEPTILLAIIVDDGFCHDAFIVSEPEPEPEPGAESRVGSGAIRALLAGVGFGSGLRAWRKGLE